MVHLIIKLFVVSQLNKFAQRLTITFRTSLLIIDTNNYKRKELSKVTSSFCCAQIRQMHKVDEIMTDVDTLAVTHV